MVGYLWVIFDKRMNEGPNVKMNRNDWKYYSLSLNESHTKIKYIQLPNEIVTDDTPTEYAKNGAE